MANKEASLGSSAADADVDILGVVVVVFVFVAVVVWKTAWARASYRQLIAG